LASGWGTTKPVAAGANNNDAVSSTLMEVVLPVLSSAECRRYQSVTDTQICTYEPGKDTCQVRASYSTTTLVLYSYSLLIWFCREIRVVPLTSRTPTAITTLSEL
jgi:hypothetical protein